MFERFSDHARRVMVLAQEQARLLGHGHIGTEHLLLGLLVEPGPVATVLGDLGVTHEAVVAALRQADVPPPGGAGVPFTSRAKRALEEALRQSLALGAADIDPAHLLLGLMAVDDGRAAELVERVGSSPPAVRQAVIRMLARQPEVRTGATVSPPSRARLAREAVLRAPADRCVLCGRDLWEVEHFVVAGRTRICDACVAAASRSIAQAAPGTRRVVLPPRLSGEAPTSTAVDEVVAAVVVAFGVSGTAADRAAHVEDFEVLAPGLRELAARAPVQLDGVRVTRVRFTRPDLAEVDVHLDLATGAERDFEGTVRRDEDRWVVTRTTVDRAMGTAGLTPPE